MPDILRWVEFGMYAAFVVVGVLCWKFYGKQRR